MARPFSLQELPLVMFFLLLGLSGCHPEIVEQSTLAENDQMTITLTPDFALPTTDESSLLIAPTFTPFFPTSTIPINPSPQSQSVYCQFPFDVGLIDFLTQVYWSPNGTEIVIAEQKDIWNRGLFSVIYLINVNQLFQQGTLYQPITIETNLIIKDIAWSPSENEIVVTTMAGGFSNPVFLLDKQSQTIDEVVSGFPVAEKPIWLPNGIDVSFLTGGYLYITEITEGTFTRMMPVANIQDYAWSPDYQQIAVSRLLGKAQNPYKQDIFVLDPSGDSSIRLTDDSQCVASPRWSPDGLSILFEAGQNSGYDLYKVNPNGTQQINLTQSEGFEFQAQWSPDGNQVVFVSHLVDVDISLPNDGLQDLFLINADGSGFKQLTFTPKEFELWPSWSPDGGYLAYVVYHHETRERTIHLLEPKTLAHYHFILP